jgi:hypothetical protein
MAEAPAPAAERFEPDALWKAAMGGGPLDWSRLANREGARRLLLGVRAGGTARRAALAALPLADDAELALGELCDITEASTGEDAAQLLRGVHDILAQPRPDRERLDVEGPRRCRAGLPGLAKRPDLPRQARDLAASALVLLEEPGWLGAPAAP